MIDLAPHNPYGLRLRSAVLTAAGCFGYGVEYARLVDLNQIGAIVTPSISLRGRRGPAPRLLETPAGLLYVGGWPDPGLEYVLAQYAPVWAGWSTPVLLSVVGASPEEYAQLAAALEGVEGIAGLELNLMAHSEQAARIVRTTRAVTQLPLMAKLAFTSALDQLTGAVAGAGADALTLVGPPRGAANDPATGTQVGGWLCGPAIHPLACAAVASTNAGIPIVGCGGIASVGDARQMLAAGAAAVQIGSALLIDPGAAARIGQAIGSAIA